MGTCRLWNVEDLVTDTVDARVIDGKIVLTAWDILPAESGEPPRVAFVQLDPSDAARLADWIARQANS